MQRVSRSIFAGLLAVAGLTACGDKVTVPPATSLTIGGQTGVTAVTVSPLSTTLAVGQSIQLVASVTASAGLARTVTWTSTNAAIATVSSAGLVAAVASGTVSIVATAVADPTQSAAASIIVTPTTATAVSIASINVNCAGIVGCTPGPVNLAAVAGQVDVTVNVDPGTQTITALNLIVNPSSTGGDTIVASQTGVSLNVAALAKKSGASATSVPVILSFNTAAFNKTSGAAAFRNGNYTIKAAAVLAGGANSTASSTQSATFANADFIGIAQTTATTATDGAGLAWGGGTLTVNVTPVLYTAGRAMKSVTVTAPGASSAITLTTLPSAATFVSTISATTGAQTAATGTSSVGAVTNAAFVVAIASVDSSGNPGPAATLPAAIRLDEAPPAVPVTFNIGTAATPMTVPWVNAAYKFSSGFTAGLDAGVGAAGTSGVTATFLAIPKASFTALAGAATNATLAVVGPPAVAAQNSLGAKGFGTACATPTGAVAVTTGASLAQSLPGDTTTYRLRVVQSDALGNLSCADLNYGAVQAAAPGNAGVVNSFGVDLGLPVNVALVTGAGAAANGAVAGSQAAIGTYTWVLQDSISGFSATPISGTIVQNFITNTLAACTAGAFGTSCKAATLANGISATGTANNDAVDGYFTMNSTVSDQAGNSVALPATTVLVDHIAPAAAVGGGVSIPAAVGGTTVSYTGNVTDNVDLVGSNGSLVYPGLTFAQGIEFPTTITPQHAAFSGTRDTTGTVTLTVSSFISNLAQTTGGNAPTGALGSLPASVNTRGVDGAGLFGGLNTPLPATTISNGTGASVFGTAAVAPVTVVFATFADNNAVVNLSNGTGALARSVTLTAQVTGAQGVTVPFSNVCWYYLDTSAGGTNEYIQIGCQSLAVATQVLPGPTNNWLWTGPLFDPPANLGTGPGNVSIIAIGYGVGGSALVSQVNANIALNN